MALLFELMDCNLYEYYKNKKNSMTIERVRNIVHDLLDAVLHVHKKGIFHRDIKPENILMSGEKVMKLADFGSCKSISPFYIGLLSKRPYTEYISTRWYRAP